MDTSNISHSDLEDFEQELLRRNAAIDSQGAAATEAAEAALRYQSERLKAQDSDLDDAALVQRVLGTAAETSRTPDIGDTSTVPSQGIQCTRRNSNARRPLNDGGAMEDATARIHKARVKQLQDDLKEAIKNAEVHEKRNRDLEAENKTLKADSLALQKGTKQLSAQADRFKKAAEEAKSQLEVREKELVEARKEAERERRSQRATESDTRNREARLNRALEEVDKYKSLLEESREQSKGGKEGYQHELDKLRSENKKLDRQKQELMTAFKKQMKLIDILKKQKIHLEAARMLAFTEEEFAATLDSRF